MVQALKTDTVPEKQPNLLLVENDVEIFHWLFNKLDKRIEPSSFQWASNLNEANGKLKSYCADIIILDLHLPDGNGIELLKKFKKEKIIKTVYVFSGNKELKGTCFRLGASRFFDKTTESEVLINELEKTYVKASYSG